VIPDLVVKSLSEAIVQEQTLATDEEAIWSFQLKGLASPVELPTPASPSTKPIAPFNGMITLAINDKWSAWTGEEPNHIWTGLDRSIALLQHKSPRQLYPVYVLLSSPERLQHQENWIQGHFHAK
jgi:hypothetical protein